MENEFKVYVIYKDGIPLNNMSNKTVYVKESSAKQVITTLSKYYAPSIYYKEMGKKKYYEDLNKEERQIWINKARSHYEIREFVENKNK